MRVSLSPAYGGPVPANTSVVDWDVATRVGTRLARPGPALTPSEARDVVRTLRSGAVEARAHVRAFTRLDAPAAAAAVEVVDRPTWVRANADGMRLMLAPLEDVLAAKMAGAAGSSVRKAGGALTGAEAGAALAWLSGKVLGQYDLYGGPAAGGRLLLVAPNIAQAERELEVDHADFRLWVCLHEETHRVQFTAVPWLREHLISEVRTLVEGVSQDVSSGDLGSRVGEVTSALARAVRGDSEVSLTGLLQGPEQRERVARLTAVMTLLEGHADVVMDGVGPQVIPSVEHIRSQFQRRRDEAGPVESLIRRLLGMEAKLRQYREGAAFVRAVVADRGMAGFNVVWEAPANLPSAEEIKAPADWVARVLGSRG
jgi:coenzyme F420 biosynthesis associated uncharacterized protein